MRLTRKINRRSIKPSPNPPKPTIQSAVESGGAITVTYQTGMVMTGDASGFSFTASGGALTVSFIVASENTFIIVMSRNPASDETVTMTYVPQNSAVNDVHQPIVSNNPQYAKAQYNFPVTVT